MIVFVTPERPPHVGRLGLHQRRREPSALRVALYRYVKFFSDRVRGVIGFACCVMPSKLGEILRADIAVTPIRLPENLQFAAFFRVRNGVDRRASRADACILAIT